MKNCSYQVLLFLLSFAYCQKPTCYVTDTSCSAIGYLLPELTGKKNLNSRSPTVNNPNQTIQQIQFTGVSNLKILSSTSVSLSWTQATSTASSSSEIEYLVYSSNISNGQNFNSPLLTTSKGATSVTVSSLTANTDIYFVVRARDTTGSMDTNSNQRAAILNGLIRFIPLDNGSLLTMEKIGNQLITAQGTPQLTATNRFGVANSVYTFNGSNQYFEFNNTLPTALPTGNSPKTFCAWIRTTSTTNQTILGYGQTASQQANFILTQFSGFSYLSYDQSGSFGANGIVNTFLSNGSWHFVCVTNQDLAGNSLIGFQVNSNY
jgi:hypothetical protein